MPAKFVVRSANARLRFSPQHRCDSQCSPLSARDSIYDLAAAVDAVATGEVPGVRGLSRGPINPHPTTIQGNAAYLFQHGQQRRLSNCWNHKIAEN